MRRVIKSNKCQSPSLKEKALGFSLEFSRTDRNVSVLDVVLPKGPVTMPLSTPFTLRSIMNDAALFYPFTGRAAGGRINSRLTERKCITYT